MILQLHVFQISLNPRGIINKIVFTELSPGVF